MGDFAEQEIVLTSTAVVSQISRGRQQARWLFARIRRTAGAAAERLLK